MRYILILIISGFLASCHKKPPLPPGLLGKWVLSKSSNGDTLHYTFQAYRGPSRILQIQPGNKYSWYYSFSLAESGTYSVSPADTAGGHPENMVITFIHDNISYKRYYLQTSDRTLYFYDYDASTRYAALATQAYYQKIY